MHASHAILIAVKNARAVATRAQSATIVYRCRPPAPTRAESCMGRSCGGATTLFHGPPPLRNNVRSGWIPTTRPDRACIAKRGPPPLCDATYCGHRFL